MSFEYKVSRCTFKRNPLNDDHAQRLVEEWLNGLGKEGWELVSIIPPGAYVFKRPLEEITMTATESIFLPD